MSAAELSAAQVARQTGQGEGLHGPPPQPPPPGHPTSAGGS